MSRPWQKWMPLHCAAYIGDTQHLNAAEHGAYLLLIMHYWTTGGLPTSDKLLARIAKMTDVEWAESRELISAFFNEDWTHERVEKEMAEAEDAYQRRAQAGRQGAGARAARASNAKAMPPSEPSIASAMPEQCSSTKQTHSSDEEVWVSARKEICQAFAAAGSPSIPNTAHMALWQTRGYKPDVCVAVVKSIIEGKPSISRLSYFDEPIRKAHENPPPSSGARYGPSRSTRRNNALDFFADQFDEPDRDAVSQTGSETSSALFINSELDRPEPIIAASRWGGEMVGASVYDADSYRAKRFG